MIVSPIDSKRTVAISEALRTATSADFTRGKYVICVNALVKSSVLVSVTEQPPRGRYEAFDNDFYQTAIAPKATVAFNYRGHFSTGTPTQLNVLVELVRQLSGSSSQLRLAYKVCDSSVVSNCYLSETDLKFTGKSSLTELKSSKGLVTFGSLIHDPIEF